MRARGPATARLDSLEAFLAERQLRRPGTYAHLSADRLAGFAERWADWGADLYRQAEAQGRPTVSLDRLSARYGPPRPH